MTGHAYGERFWMLGSAIQRVQVPQSLIGTTVFVRCVSPGQSVSDVTSKTVVIVANSYPYVPATEPGMDDWSVLMATMGT